MVHFFFALAMINNCKSSFARNESFIIIFFFNSNDRKSKRIIFKNPNRVQSKYRFRKRFNFE